ncbi:MAG: proline dehydrogenase family protein [Candidatus Nanopelagicales bacterium]|nr:proline dehydrogenase family protein [Candidatus Nanopelagicales bacterium]MDZ4249332.1 proline dehydrogenase family protein [Candidatus Nanopelagicales bacterium]
MLSRTLLAVSRSDRIRGLSVAMPGTRQIVNRFVAGEQIPDAIGVAADLAASGRYSAIDRLGEDIVELSQAQETRDEYLELLESLAANGLADEAEVSLKLSSIGLALPDGEKIALGHARQIAEAADEAGTTLTLDMEDHTTTDTVLATVRELRKDYPGIGVVLQACLYRTEADCRELSGEGSRVRLCKGAYREPESVAYQAPHEIDLAYVRCLRILMEGTGYPMVATHDPRLVDIAQALAIHNDRPRGSYEFQMLLGVRPEEQQRLADQGERVSVYVPFGPDWYEYMVRRMAEKPANLALLVKSLSSKK